MDRKSIDQTESNGLNVECCRERLIEESTHIRVLIVASNLRPKPLGSTLVEHQN